MPFTHSNKSGGRLTNQLLIDQTETVQVGGTVVSKPTKPLNVNVTEEEVEE